MRFPVDTAELLENPQMSPRNLRLIIGLQVAFGLIGLETIHSAVAFASAHSASCPGSSVQETLSSSLQQLSKVADAMSIENLPQNVLAADQALVSAISQVILQVEYACFTPEGASPPDDLSTLPVITPAPTTTSTTRLAETPTTIVVTASLLNVRSLPTASASLVGQPLSSGTELTAVGEVTGESINTNDLWYVTASSTYVWSGGAQPAAVGLSDGNGSSQAVTVAGTSSSEATLATTPETSPPTGSLPAPIAKTITSGGVSYAVTFSYLEDGEVRATFTYRGRPYAVQNYNVIPAETIALIESNGSFTIPWTGQADLTLISLANQISLNAPASQEVFPGFAFETPLWYPGPVSSPANAFYVIRSDYSSVPQGIYYLDLNSAGNLVGVTPVTISATGEVTEGQEIIVQESGSVPSELYSELQSAPDIATALSIANAAGLTV